jgi:hypothetical protein
MELKAEMGPRRSIFKMRKTLAYFEIKGEQLVKE